MSAFRIFGRRRGAALALALFASLISCGREVTGPGGRGAVVGLHFAPDYSAMIEQAGDLADAVSDLVPFTRVKVELRRVDNSVAASEIVEFPADATEIPLTLTVRLGAAAQDGAEPMTAYLRYINAAGDTVFAGQIPVTVEVPRRGEQPAPVQVPVAPTVPGAVFARVDITPDTLSAISGQPVNFSAIGYDAQDNVVPNAIIGFISRNPTLAVVPDVGSGEVNLIGVRGFTWIVAQSLTGVKDSAFLVVLPRPASLVKVSGDAQSTLTGAAFAQPLRVRVLASDGLPVRGWPVTFAATAGGGIVSSSVVPTDTAGYAEVTWTAGTTAGAASVTASVSAPALSVTFTGTQGSTLPTSLAFLTQPTAITAGIALPDILVNVRNGLGQTVPDFTGPVTLGLTDGTAGAALVGTTTVNAVAGVATFSGITVNKGGTGYRLTATYDQLPPALSNPFNAAAAGASTITLLGGGGQVAPPSTALPDSIRVRVTDVFGFPVVGATVQFGVLAGGGSVSEASRVTDADGRAGVVWTLGESGAQQLRAGLGPTGGIETIVSAAIIAGGSVSLFAGFDYTFVRAGGSKLIPIYLTNPSASPIAVTLSVDDTSTTKMAWASSTVNIPPGTTRLDVALNGLAVGEGWAIMRSGFGDDSVFVSIDSSVVSILQPDQSNFAEGDTIRTFVKLSEPAPAGGTTVVLRSVSPEVAQVAPSSGSGAPQPGCTSEFCFGLDAVMTVREDADPTDAPTRLLAPPADTAAVFIPEGQLYGEFAIVFASDVGTGTSVQIAAAAVGFVGDAATYGVQPLTASAFGDFSNDPRYGVGIGQTVGFDVYTSVRRRKPTVVRLESSQPARVQVDTAVLVAPGTTIAPRVQARVVGTDSAWVRYWIGGGAADSLLIVGAPAKLEVEAFNSLPEGGARDVTIKLTGVGNPWSSFRSATPLTVTLQSDNPAVMVVDEPIVTVPAGESFTTRRVRWVGAGTANLIATAAGYESDTLDFSNGFPPAVYANSSSVGVGTLADIYVELESDALRQSPRTVQVQSLDTTVLAVLTPTVVVGGEFVGTYVRVRGVSPGAATLRFTGDGILQSDAFVAVQGLVPVIANPTQYVPDGITRDLTALLYDGSTARPLADTVHALLRSTDATVLEVVDSVVTFPAGDYNSVGGSYRPRAPGNALLWLVLPGVDSALVSVTVTPFAISLDFPSAVVGQRLEEPFALFREGPDTLAATITITQSGPGRVRFRTPITAFGVGAFTAASEMVGDSVGIDTLTIAVDGYPTVQKVVYVENTSLTLDNNDFNPAVGAVDAFVRNGFAVTGVPGNIIAGDTLRFVVRSLDTTLAVVEQDTVRWLPGDAYEPTQYARVRYKRVGTVALSVTDVDGVLPGDTLSAYIYPAELSGFAGNGFNNGSLGMNQRTFADEAYVARSAASPEPLTVYFTSSNPTLVQVPDSVVIPAGALTEYFTYAAGDSTGSARVTASAPGYNPWEFDVLVSRARFGVWPQTLFTDAGAPMEVWTEDAMTGNVRALRTPVNVRVSTLTPTLLDTTGATFTIPADSSYVYRDGPRGIARGSGTMLLVDDGPARFDSVLATAANVDIADATVEMARARIVLTPGLVSENFQTDVDVKSAQDTLWLQVASLRGTAALVDDSVRVVLWDPRNAGGGVSALSETLRLRLRALTAGNDSLVVSGPGLRPDTVLVQMGQGFLRETAPPVNVFVGDSVAVQLLVFDGGGGAAVADVNHTFNVSLNNFTVREGGAAVGTVTLNGGQGVMTVWLRAENAGQGTLLLTHPNFRDYRLTLNAVERP